MESKKYAPKKANCTKPASKYERVNNSRSLGINESTKTVINPQRKNNVVSKMKEER